MSDNVVEIKGISRQYASTLALDKLDLEIPPGFVYGLVGVNGAGKTTLIKHILGLLRPQEGSVRVFDLDPISKPVEVLEQIGYLSEARELPEWMRIDELLRYTSAYYPSWDSSYAEELIELFGLERSKKVRELSKGMRAPSRLDRGGSGSSGSVVARRAVDRPGRRGSTRHPQCHCQNRCR